MNPLLSIIIPLYNKQDYILKTLNSVLSQECDDYEIVIVDDGSTDKSVQLVENIVDKKIHLFQKKNGGPSSARNYGVKKAKGEWVLFLDADDTLEKDAIKLVLTDIKKHPYVDVFCYAEYVLENGKKSFCPIYHTKGYVLCPFLDWFLGRIYPGPGRMVVRNKCMQQEPFREDLRRWEDGECIFRLMRKYRFYANPTPLFTYCRDNIEASKPRKNLSEDFICNMRPQGKSFFEQLVMYKLYKDEVRWLYPNDAVAIYGETFNKVKYRRAEKYLKLYMLQLVKWEHLKKRIIKRLFFK